ncbi:MAG: glycosyltransferase family 4 protein [Boseongicola sp.]
MQQEAALGEISATDMAAPRVAAVVFAYCPADARVRRESEAMAERGMQVDIVCLRGPEQNWIEDTGRIRFIRLPIARKRGGKLRYLWEYTAFTFLAMLVMSYLHMRNWYRIVHVHNMPDVLVFCALVPRLLGAKIILDLHDPVPEVFMTKYDMTKDHNFIGLLRFLEHISISFSHAVLTPNVGFKDLFIARGCPEEKIHVVMNSPQETVFGEPLPGAPTRLSPPRDDRFKIMFHGTVVERHGLDTALEALSLLAPTEPGLLFDVYGDGEYVETFLELVETHGLGDIVTYHGHVPLETIAAAIDGIDLGLIPNKQSVFTEINLPTRIFEYLSKNKPVIAPRTRGILDYFEKDDILFFAAGDAQSLAAAIRRARSDMELRRRVLSRGIEVYRKHSWSKERVRLIDIVTGLIGNK